jgi:hypothetical protein
MAEEHDVISADEFLLRRIHKNHVDAGPPMVVGFASFRPAPEDVDGLSVFREKLISALHVAASGRKPGEYYVVRLAVVALQSLGLTVVADDQPTSSLGHALIPELSLAACQADKRHTREIQHRLAELASHSIVQFPTE